MPTNPSKRKPLQPNEPVMRWLLDSDPSIRWQTLQDWAGAAPAEVTAERARVAAQGRERGCSPSRGQTGSGAGRRGTTAGTLLCTS
jgi:hypothetical protein